MGTKVDQQTKEIEAKKLRALISARWDDSDASFAKECGRERAELKQHLDSSRPIPLTAVKAYARVLKCSVSDISERWAAELSGDENSDTASQKVTHLPAPRDVLTQELIEIADRLTDRGKIELIGMAKALCATHSKLASINAKSSQ